MIDDGVERHAWAFVHEEVPDAPHPVPGLGGDVGEWGVMQDAWRANGKQSMDELQCANFRVFVTAELDYNPGRKSGDLVDSINLDTFKGFKLLRGGRGG